VPPSSVTAVSSGRPSFAVFVPDDDAFKDFREKSGLTIEEFLASPDARAILANHANPG